MNHRILLALGPNRPQRSYLAAIEAAGLEAEVARDPAEPFEGIEPDLCVSAVVLDPESLERPLGEVLAELGKRLPLASCVLAGGSGPLPEVRGLHLRRVPEPVHGPVLREAIEQALGDNRAKRAELQFASADGGADHLDEARVRRLYRLTRALSKVNDLASVSLLAAEAVQDLLPGRGVQVQLWDPSHPGVCAEASAGSEMGDQMVRMPLEVPLGRVGELTVDGSGGAPFDEAGEAILAAAAAPVAAAAQSQIQRLDRSRAQEATLLAMARIADMRDNETGQHLSRVSHYSVLIAEGMRDDGHCRDEITPEFIEDLFRCAPLHDLGKVAIPDAILLKAGRLSPMEWELMKSHPTVGALILDQLMEENPVLGFISMGRDIAHCHHEKWDGSGYPEGVAGDDIPLSARIVALADIYDALTTERSYKSAWSHSEALAYLGDLSGTHLDPRVLAAFLTREDQVDQIRTRLADDPVCAPEDARHAA